MNETYHGSPELLKGENVLLGALGALLCSLGGGIVCVLLLQLDIIAGLAGFLAVWLAYWGYRKFSGAKSSIKGVVISVIISLIVLAASMYLGYVIVIIRAFGEMGLSLSLDRAFSYMQEFLLNDDELRSGFIRDCLLLLVFTAIVSCSLIVTAVKQAKADKNPQPAIPQTQEPWTQPESSDKE